MAPCWSRTGCPAGSEQTRDAAAPAARVPPRRPYPPGPVVPAAQPLVEYVVVAGARAVKLTVFDVPARVTTARQPVSPGGIIHRSSPSAEPLCRFGPDGVGTCNEKPVFDQPVTVRAAQLPGSPQLTVVASVPQPFGLPGVNHSCGYPEPKLVPVTRGTGSAARRCGW